MTRRTDSDDVEVVAPASTGDTGGTTSREFGKNSNGEPEMYPSDVLSLQTKHNLTAPEAEDFWKRTVVNGESEDSALSAIQGGRVIYRQSYEMVVNPPEHALTAAQLRLEKTQLEMRREEELAEERQGAVTTPTADRTQPEAGPWGPYAEYKQVEVPPEEVAHNAGVPVSVVKGEDSK